MAVEDLGVVDPGVVIDPGADELVADPLPGSPMLHPVGPPATIVRDPCQFLDIDVDQLTGQAPQTGSKAW